jgi:rare lipoprotein A
MLVLTVRSAGKALAAKSLSKAAAVGAVTLSIFAIADIGSADAKTPGTVHCYGGFCHRINSIDEMDGMVGRRGFVTASYYDDCRRDRFNPCGLTSSGAIFRPDRPDNAASPIFPDGTVLLTYNPATKLAAVVRVTSAGPYRGDRTLDVSRATAEHLGFAKRGVAPLEVVILKSPEEHEARYKKLREYAPVPGFMGKFATFEAAHDQAVAQLRMETAGMAVAAATDPRADLERQFPRQQAQKLNDARPESIPLAAAPPVVELASLGSEASFASPVAEQFPVATEEVLAREQLEPLTWKDRLASMIEDARLKARLSRQARDVAAIANELELPFAERFAAFVRAAQMRARLDAKPAKNDVIAEQ